MHGATETELHALLTPRRGRALRLESTDRTRIISIIIIIIIGKGFNVAQIISTVSSSGYER